MSLKNDIALLSAVPLFKGLNEEQLRLLAFGADRRPFARGHTLFTPGTRVSAAFVVASGKIGLATPTRQGNRRLEDAGPGSLLCELALISEYECGLTAVAIEDCEVLQVTRSLFSRMLEEFPQLAVTFDQRIRENLNRMISELGRIETRFS
jgi:CRP-like cAMP-binding protein